MIRPFEADLANDYAPDRQVRVWGTLPDDNYILEATDSDGLYTFSLLIPLEKTVIDDIGRYGELANTYIDYNAGKHRLMIELDYDAPFLPGEEPYFNGTLIRVYVGGDFTQELNLEAMAAEEGIKDAVILPLDWRGSISLEFDRRGQYKRGGYSIIIKEL
jgi:hypothetical protein